jgi:hypothetical protein
MRHIWRRVAARFEVTDEEHVQGIRRTVAFYDRWRRPLLALYVAAAVMFIAAVSLLQGLMQWGNMQGLVPGFVVGLCRGDVRTLSLAKTRTSNRRIDPAGSARLHWLLLVAPAGRKMRKRRDRTQRLHF